MRPIRILLNCTFAVPVLIMLIIFTFAVAAGRAALHFGRDLHETFESFEIGPNPKFFITGEKFFWEA